MNSRKRQARFAGFLYTLANVPAPFALVYVPRRLIVPGDATTTANHIRNSVGLLRMAIAGELINSTLLVFAVLAFYRLFKQVNERHARAMLVLILLSVPISLFNVLNEVAALMLTSGAPVLSAFNPAQLDTMALLFLRLHNYGIGMAGIFWGLWLFPFGILAIRSGFIPRWIGLCMMLAGVPYLAAAAATFVVPQLTYFSRLLGFLMFGEVPMIVWLLIWGAKEQRSHPG
jgi:Domain of unknown function (DUF4386)